MKKTICIMLVLCLCFTALLNWPRPAKAEPLDTYHSGWHLIRDTADEDAADFLTALPLTTSEGDFANKPTGAFRILSKRAGSRNQGFSAGGAWQIVFSGSTTDGDDDSETFSYTLVGWAKLNGMAQVICEGAGAIGLQDVVLYPDDSASAASIWWADTLTISNSTLWGSVVAYNSGNNRVAFLSIDATGLEWLQVFIYDANGTGTEAGDITVFGRRY